MTRKALVVVGLAAVIAASTGVAFASNTPKQVVRGADSDPVTSSVQGGASDTAVDSSDSYQSDTNEAVQTVNASEPEVEDSNKISETTAGRQAQDEQSPIDNIGGTDVSDASSASPRIPFAQYTLRQILDQNSGEELSPRVVFGKFFNECRLTLYSDSTLDLCLNPSTGESETGSYYIDNDIMAVSFGSDRETAFHLIFNDDGAIDYIIVPSGDMLIYFS